MVADEAITIFDQICDAVSHVHSHKILHRDIKLRMSSSKMMVRCW